MKRPDAPFNSHSEATGSADVQPFLVEPLIYGRLHRGAVRPAVVLVVALAVAVISLTWAAAIPGLLFSALDPWHALLVLLGKEVPPGQLPLLSDFPSLLLAVTITCSFCLVYHLFMIVSTLHKRLLETRSLQGRDGELPIEFIEALARLNGRLSRAGSFAPVAFIICLSVAGFINARQGEALLRVYGSANWWASWHNIPGFAVWSLFGGIGLYAVYVEAILGVNYVGFLKQIRNLMVIRVNPGNPDGCWGWLPLREALSNMQIGIILTALTSIALWPFLSSAVGLYLGAVMILAFIFVVGYVYFGSTSILRQRAQADRSARVLALGDIETDRRPLAVIAYELRLGRLQKIPQSPLRAGSVAVPLLSLSVPLTEIVLALVRSLGN